MAWQGSFPSKIQFSMLEMAWLCWALLQFYVNLCSCILSRYLKLILSRRYRMDTDKRYNLKCICQNPLLFWIALSLLYERYHSYFYLNLLGLKTVSSIVVYPLCSAVEEQCVFLTLDQRNILKLSGFCPSIH